MNDDMRNGEDEYAGDDGTMEDKDGRSIPKFRLPKRLRGRMFLEQARIHPRDLPTILSQTKTTHIDRLQKILIEAYDDKAIRAMDQRQQYSPFIEDSLR